ncbi:hypothetical protein OSB04_016004 [Centaurea solstitialis]|uniref:MATH domain-containing protein n=1 Tax=Centaurea solstitialis TaxID=347529 RepID=A0AA38WJA4_9ASTR|nr:hypothetical protein OSB04_016004 [Centaurea solstitialis]
MLVSKRKHEPSHYMFKIESFSLLLDQSPRTKIESDVFEASGHKWKLELYPNGNEMKKVGNDQMSLYLIICDTESLPKGWEVCVDVSFFLYDHTQHNYATFQDIENGNRTKFHEKKMKWGFDKLISLESFKKSENGYLENDSCVFGAEVFAVTEYAQKDRCLSMIKPPPNLKPYIWIIDNISSLTEGPDLYSGIFKACKVNWKLHTRFKKSVISVGKYLAIFLEIHDADLLPVGWKVYARYKLRLKNQSDKGEMEEELKLGYWFDESHVSCGAPCFMPFSKNEKETLLNGRLIVEAEILYVGMFRNFI